MISDWQYKGGYRDVSELMGKTLTAVENVGASGEDQLRFTVDDGSSYLMYHDQDCCEHVALEDVCGDLQDLVGSPITMAEEVSNINYPAPPNAESYTWTFYKFATVKGYVTLRWLGESNGYYSESVSFKIEEAE